MKIGIFFGSTTGNTESISELICSKFDDKATIEFIDNLDQDKIDKFELLIFGIPTWNIGELESSWEDFFPNLDNLDFSNSIIAIFGLGDQISYGDTYVDAMGILYDKMKENGANIIGSWSVEGYDFYDSLAIKEGQFVGLALDVDNQNEKTESRVDEWVSQIKDEFLEIQEKVTLH